MEEALRTHLLAHAGLAALVGTRISWGRRNRGEALPAVVLHRVDGERNYHLDGPSGLVRSRVQVDCWGETLADAKGAARAVASTLSGLQETVSGIDLQGAFLRGERDLTDDGSEAAEQVFRTSLDFQIWHSE